MIEIDIKGLPELTAMLAAMPAALQTAFALKLQALSQSLTDKVKDKLSGDVLSERSGRLKESITSDVEQSGDRSSASVSAGDGLPYAAIQEYGGQTKAHVIAAVNGKALAFNWQGKDVFFAHVMHPGSVIPERSYLRSSLADMNDEVLTAFTDAIEEFLKP